MKNAFFVCRLALLVALIPLSGFCQQQEMLHLVGTVPLPEVKGRLDHMDVDVKGERLFLSGLENGTVEVVDLRAKRRTQSIRGLQKPQGVAWIESLKKLYVASGDDGVLRTYGGGGLTPAGSIPLEKGANRVAFDPRANLLYVGYGGKDAGKDYGQVGVIDVRQNKLVGEIRVSAHPSELLLNAAGDTLYVFISVLSQVEVVDLHARRVTGTWPVSSKGPGDAALDGGLRRLFIGTHQPPNLIVMNSESGKEVARLPGPEGMDGVYFDAKRNRIYMSGGRGAETGYVFVYRQVDPEHYQLLDRIATKPGAGTSFWSPELDRYFVAAPASGGGEASILIFEPR